MVSHKKILQSGTTLADGRSITGCNDWTQISRWRRRSETIIDLEEIGNSRIFNYKSSVTPCGIHQPKSATTKQPRRRSSFDIISRKRTTSSTRFRVAGVYSRKPASPTRNPAQRTPKLSRKIATSSTKPSKKAQEHGRHSSLYRPVENVCQWRSDTRLVRAKFAPKRGIVGAARLDVLAWCSHRRQQVVLSRFPEYVIAENAKHIILALYKEFQADQIIVFDGASYFRASPSCGCRYNVRI